MRLLFVIPHYFSEPSSGEDLQQGLPRKYGSMTSPAAARAAAVRKTVASLHQTFGQSQAMIRHVDRRTIAANDQLSHEVHVVMVTDGRHHVLSEAELPDSMWHHCSLDGDPAQLGFHCRRILRDRWGNYDYYSYLEDDLSISDPWFFEKLRWFTSHLGDEKLLMPNRFEKAVGQAVDKCYLDGDLRREVTEPFQDVGETPELQSTVIGKTVRFVRPLNPHSGCYFLNHQQMGSWIQQPDFDSVSADFIGPLESAATLGVMRSFRLYKPAPENASFLEIEHHGSRFIGLIRGK